ncbi:MAG: amidohydrolase [Clostridia bacterium]|nr:amidohydrolase [Clostridia bacterium]
MKTLFENAAILAWENGRFRHIPRGFLAVDGDTIASIGTDRPAGRFDAVKDMTGRLLMPGLVNNHCHAAMTLLRGLGSDLPLKTWLEEHMFPVEDRMTDEDIIAGHELGMMEMLASGVTSFTDMYMHPRGMVRSAERIGMKVNLNRAILSFGPDTTCDDLPTFREMREVFEESQFAANGRIRVDFGVHAEYTNTERVVREFVRRLLPLRERGARMHIHLSETESEHRECTERHGCTPAEWFDRVGLFGFPTTAAHCVYATQSDMALMQMRGVSPVHCPTSNLKLGSGVAPIPEMLAAGLNVTLGTDGAASNNNLNMFEEMHLAAILHKGARRDPVLVSPETVLKMATVNGARAQGRTDTGTLEPGKKADIIAVDFRDRAHLFPAPDPMAMLVYSAQSTDVCMTMVDGTVLYENGKYFTLDKAAVLNNAKAAAERLFGASEETR